MLKLRASARLKRRYLLLSASKKTIEEAILEYIGVLGWAKAAPFIKSGKDGKTILIVNREEIVPIRAALALSKERIEIHRVSGTLKGLGQNNKHKP